jgi:hypothetical protein
MAAKAKQTFGYRLTNFKINPKPNFTSKLNWLKFNTPLGHQAQQEENGGHN